MDATHARTPRHEGRTESLPKCRYTALNFAVARIDNADASTPPPSAEHIRPAANAGTARRCLPPSRHPAKCVGRRSRLVLGATPPAGARRLPHPAESVVSEVRDLSAAVEWSGSLSRARVRGRRSWPFSFTSRRRPRGRRVMRGRGGIAAAVAAALALCAGLGLGFALWARSSALDPSPAHAADHDPVVVAIAGDHNQSALDLPEPIQAGLTATAVNNGHVTILVVDGDGRTSTRTVDLTPRYGDQIDQVGTRRQTTARANVRHLNDELRQTVATVGGRSLLAGL
jgi:hypothetical protein